MMNTKSSNTLPAIALFALSIFVSAIDTLARLKSGGKQISPDLTFI
jgi:hypothetical protein